MTANKFSRNLSANTLQLLANQVFGLVIFYVLSKELDKNVFGQLNWCLAVLLAAFAVLSFGIDQVMVKKIAAGHSREAIFNSYLFHVIISGGLFYTLLIVVYVFARGRLPYLTFLLLIGTGKLAIFLSSPFKQLATGLEQFRSLLFMSVTSNIVRGTALLLLCALDSISVSTVIIVFIAGDLLELFLCAVLARPMLGSTYRFRRNRPVHRLLLKESLPQTGVVVFTAIMSRLDWILVGLLISSTKLAEYSFAWKAFEMATFPLLVIAPLMIPLFARLYQSAAPICDLSFFLEWQIITATLVVLLLNICWSPVIDFITGGKYGAVNASTIFLLSLSMPLLYFNNYLWTILFTRGKLKRIFFIMAISFAVNIGSCCILIPLFKNEGAAVAYFLTLVTQTALYLKQELLILPRGRWLSLCRWPILAGLTGWLVKTLATTTATNALLAMMIYSGLVLASKQLRAKDWKTLQSLY